MALDLPDNGIDEDCSGRDASAFTFIWKDLNNSNAIIHYPEAIQAELNIYNTSGKLMQTQQLDFTPRYLEVEFDNLTTGFYIITLSDSDYEIFYTNKLFIGQ